jgi:alpha-tubulin suppressor-like RCC1 family protein
VLCQGDDRYGQLGDAGSVSSSFEPVAVGGGMQLHGVSAGTYHACALDANDAAVCWGYNYYGELGIGTSGANSDSNVPVAVAGGLTFVAISAGQTHTCALVKGGAAYCWGDPNTLGTASPGAGSVPVAVDGGLTFTSLSAGGHSCGLAKGGQAYCWGYNFAGEIGDGTTVARPTPVPVAGALSLSTVTAGGGHTCALTLNSGAWCWGENSDGQLGNGDVGIDRSAPTPVATP